MGYVETNKTTLGNAWNIYDDVSIGNLEERQRKYFFTSSNKRRSLNGSCTTTIPDVTGEVMYITSGGQYSGWRGSVKYLRKMSPWSDLCTFSHGWDGRGRETQRWMIRRSHQTRRSRQTQRFFSPETLIWELTRQFN